MGSTFLSRIYPALINMCTHSTWSNLEKTRSGTKNPTFYCFSMDVGNKPSLLPMWLWTLRKFSIVELLKWHSTFISGITKQIICRTWTFFAAFITDGKKWGWRYWLGAAAVVTALVCSTGCLGINAASAAAALHQRRWGTVPVWNILRLLKIKGIRRLLLSG